MYEEDYFAAIKELFTDPLTRVHVVHIFAKSQAVNGKLNGRTDRKPHGVEGSERSTVPLGSARSVETVRANRSFVGQLATGGCLGQKIEEARMARGQRSNNRFAGYRAAPTVSRAFSFRF